MCATDDAVLLWLRNHKRWPPDYPPSRGLLAPPVTAPPREEWSLEVWRDYALFLEAQGNSLAHDLARFAAQIQEQRRKLSRSKPKPASPPHAARESVGLLAGWLPVKKKRGRKPLANRDVQLGEIFAIGAALAKTRRRVTDQDALREWYARNGQRKSRADGNRTMLNAISKYRKTHKIAKW